MSHKKSLEALDRKMKDLRNSLQLFGGETVLLSGNFRLTLPVIPHSTTADELNACLKSSILWRNIIKHSLSTNMRVRLQNDESADEFAKQLLDLGNGRMPRDITTGLVTLSSNFCTISPTVQDLVQSVFPDIERNYQNHQWLGERAMLAAKNKDFNSPNIAIQNEIPSETVTYKSVDIVIDKG